MRQASGIVEKVIAGSTNLVALAIGAGTLALILVLKRWPRVPAMLIAVAAATVAVAVFDLAARTGVSVLGPLPQGLPTPRLPLGHVDSLVPILMGGLAVALVSFADTSVLSRTYAARLRAPVDPNQEMVGLGVANLAAGFFQGFPISSSSSRTPVAEAAGARTQLTGVVGALAIALLLMLAPNLLQDLPHTRAGGGRHRVGASASSKCPTCAASIASSAGSSGCRWPASPVSPRFGAIPGIALAIVMAVIEFLWDGWRPHSAVLGRVDRVKGYHDITRYPDARLIPGLVLFRWDAPLFFANAELFHERVLDAVASSPTPVRWLVVAAEPVTSVDVTAADAVCELDDDAARRRHRAVLRRDEGPGQGQAETLRALRALR